jgi:hypothetical protein
LFGRQRPVELYSLGPAPGVEERGGQLALQRQVVGIALEPLLEIPDLLATRADPNLPPRAYRGTRRDR